MPSNDKSTKSQPQPRSIWSGTISFVLVNIPVRLYPATREESINFDLLHKSDHSRIRYARICKAEEKEVAYEDLVRGYEIEKGKYVEISDEDFEKADPKRSRSIQIVDFVEADEIDPIYYAHPYYLEPEEGAEKSYMLLRDALEQTKKVAIAKFVLKEKEHLAVLRPYNDGLILQQLRYSHEIREMAGLKLPKERPEKKELEMASNLIQKLTSRFNPQEFKDTYHDILMKIIEEKAKGKKITPSTEEPKATEFEDLMEKLKESLEKAPTR